MRQERPRRENAPIRRRRPATTVPDFLFAIAAMAAAMAGAFFVASFSDETITAGEAGTQLARLFSGSLAAMGGIVFVLGFLLLRDERRQADHYVVPALAGGLAGLMESALFLDPAGAWLLAPFALLLLALRPVRRALAQLAGRRGGG